MKLTSLALASVLALGAASASLAQPGPGAPPPPAGQPWAHGEHGPPDFAQMAQRHAERLRAVLQLRPEQEPALQALMTSMRPDPAEMQRWKADRDERQALTTPQRLDRAQARMAERQAAFTKRADAIKRFYAQLSPGQQRAFDALHEGHGMAGMHGHHMGGHDGDGMRGPR